ncbi:hypothetical protein [Arcanobacterium phocae]|uniref:hypothetical protein n=1 Tax=Arcanobacterium phocae TaxID=131112 RepID=UPI001C0E8F7C|nr:hypothetical protein [Arcanobacterium phocae]
MAALNESQKMKIASETLEHDWTSTHQAIENIHFLAGKFKVSELEAVELAEQSLANARDKALEYKIRLSDCVAAIIFVWASLCILRNSWTPENIKSEGIWYVSIFVVSMIIMTIFSFLLPKRPQLLVKSTRWGGLSH